MQTVGQQLGKRDLQAFRPHASLVSTDALGVELELEGFSDRDVDLANRHLNPLWVSHRDGSLRNGGIEFVTNGGFGGEQLHSAYERLIHTLDNDVNYDASWRCSTHMHVNMLDCTIPQVAKFVLAYTAAEPILFEHNGSYRRSSNFCTPVGDSMAFHRKLMGRLTPDTISTRWGAQACNKYTALNLQPLFGDGRNCPPLGTVEFRGGRPMTTIADLLTQTNILLSIKRFAMGHEGEVEDFMSQLNDGVFARIFTNGVAEQFRHVDVAVLEEAVVNAWVLQKSYAKGLANYEDQRRREEEAGLARPARGRVQLDPFMIPSSWGQTVASAENNRPNLVPPSFYQLDPNGPYMISDDSEIGDFLTDGEQLLYPRVVEMFDRFKPSAATSTKQLTKLALHALQSRQIQGSLSTAQASRIMVNWTLMLDPVTTERTPFGTMMRALRYFRDNGVPRGYKETACIAAMGYDGEPATQSARGMLDGIPLDYRGGLGSMSWVHMCGNLGISAMSNNRKVALHIQRIQVRVRNRQQLKDALAAQMEMSADRVNVPEEMAASELAILLMWAQRPSASHVNAADIAKYDRIVDCMNILFTNQLWAPVHMRFYRGSNSVYYMYGWEDHCGVHIAREARTARVSATTGNNVY